MRVYRERLGAPVSWWLCGAVCVVLFGTTLWAGLSVLTGVAAYVILTAACVTLLLWWGAARIEVSSGGLLAGRQRIPLGEIGEVAALDAAQSTALRGPRADPAAYLLLRPYLSTSVYVETPARPAGQPYWLIATRRPDELAAAIEQARRSSGDRTAWDDAAGDAVAH